MSRADKTMRRANEWIRDLNSSQSGVLAYLEQIYGSKKTVEEKRTLLIELLERYKSNFSDEPVIITRAPGRVNIMGRHVDHQGGHGNMIAIDREIFFVMGLRNDARVLLRNLEEDRFSSTEFSLHSLLDGWNGADWRDFINSDALQERVQRKIGHWSLYIQAAFARLQARFSDTKLKGMNILATGNIPIAAGLSSSSALVVAAAEGIVAANGLDISAQDFVTLCGEGEWYVGTRGGAGDHAAMKFAQKGRVVQVGFFPFHVAGSVPFPDDHYLVVCNSHEKAKKTANAKDVFNHRVACYHIGRELFKREFPEYRDRIQHLRDIKEDVLQVSYEQLLQMIAKLPTAMTRKEIRERLGDEIANSYLNSHRDIFDDYPIRSVVMFGLAESERSRKCVELLREGKVDEFGQWMTISHNGDRVFVCNDNGDPEPFHISYDDASIKKMIKESQNSRVDHNLALQPGSYRCSTQRIDRMVDIALSVNGVKGAQIAGAGLGGCMMVLVEKNAYDDFRKAMIENYYSPENLEPEIFPCSSVAGSGLLKY